MWNTYPQKIYLWPWHIKQLCRPGLIMSWDHNGILSILGWRMTKKKKRELKQYNPLCLWETLLESVILFCLMFNNTENSPTFLSFCEMLVPLLKIIGSGSILISNRWNTLLIKNYFKILLSVPINLKSLTS